VVSRSPQIRSLAPWEYRQEPHPRWAEDFSEVVPVAVVEFCVRDEEAMANEPITVVLLLAKLDCGHVVQREL